MPHAGLQRAARFPGYTLPTFDAFTREGEAGGHDQATMTGYGVAGQLDWDLGFRKPTSVTAYRRRGWSVERWRRHRACRFTVAHQENFRRPFSQELRLASDSDGPINYVAGA